MKTFDLNKRGRAPVRLGASVLAVFAAFPGLAQMPSATLDEVVVTATRVALPVADVVADVSIVDRAQIDRSGANTIAQLLSTLPGLQATSNGESDRIYIRGAEARMTALYIDGVRIDSQDGLMLGGGIPGF